MHDDYDRSSKWLIQHRGDSILRLGGVRHIQSWRPRPPEVVQPRQVLARLRYNDRQLLSIFGGSQIMIESPLIQELMAERSHKHILSLLADRFGPVPQDITTALQSIQDEQRLDALVVWAGRCADLEAFRTRLSG